MNSLCELSKWEQYFYDKAAHAASMSKDSNTRVGACIFDREDKIEVTTGWNDLPMGVKHTTERNSRPLKYKLTSHAEISAIANAARTGRSTKGKSIILTTLFPCSLCTAALINAGIKEVIAPSPDFSHEKYGEDFKLSYEMFTEAGIIIKEFRETK